MAECALVNGKWRNADEFSPLEWDRLRTSHPEIIMPCCEERGHQVLRKKKQFFRHNPGSSCACATAEESIEHYNLKCEIAIRCRKLGWSANVEQHRASAFKTDGAEWQADVLAHSGDTYIAFEVQCSPITLHSLHERDERYRHDNVQSVWLFREYPHMGEHKLTYTEIDATKTPENILELNAYPTFKTPVFGKTNAVTTPEHLYLYSHFKVLGVIFDFSSDEAFYGNMRVPLATLIESALSGKLYDDFQQGKAEYTRLMGDCKRREARFKEIKEARARIDKEQSAEHIRQKKAFNELCRGLFDPERVFTLISAELSRIEMRRRLEEIQRSSPTIRRSAQLTNPLMHSAGVEGTDSAQPGCNPYEEKEIAHWGGKINVSEYVRVSPKFVGQCIIRGCGAEPVYYDKNSHSNPFCKKHFEILREQQQSLKGKVSADQGVDDRLPLESSLCGVVKERHTAHKAARRATKSIGWKPNNVAYRSSRGKT